MTDICCNSTGFQNVSFFMLWSIKLWVYHKATLSSNVKSKLGCEPNPGIIRFVFLFFFWLVESKGFVVLFLVIYASEIVRIVFFAPTSVGECNTIMLKLRQLRSIFLLAFYHQYMKNNALCYCLLLCYYYCMDKLCMLILKLS